MSSRNERRVRCVLPVKVAGTDMEGKLFERLTCTLDISERGARITGIPDRLRPGVEVEVNYKNRRGTFRVAWIGQSGTRTENQIGLLADAQTSEFWLELNKQQSTRHAEDYAERERQAQHHAREAAPRPTNVAGIPVARNVTTPTERLKAATEELFELARLIEAGAVDRTALQEFRQALGYVRNTSWLLQQWFELQQHESEQLPLLTMLNAERMRLAANLCSDLAAFLATAKVQLDVGLRDHFLSVIRPLLVILSATSGKGADSASEDAPAKTN